MSLALTPSIATSVGGVSTHNAENHTHASAHALLDAHLRSLRLPTFVNNHRKVAEESAQANLDYERYLLVLAETQVAQRERNQQTRCIRAARLPVLKELSDFDFSALPSLNKARVLDLARGDYIAKAENLILLGAPGLGRLTPQG